MAVLIYLFSFLFKSEYTQKTSMARENHRIEQYLHEQQNLFYDLLKDTARIRRLANKKESLYEFKNIASEYPQFFLYRFGSFGDKELLFWSDQMAIPVDSTLLYPDGEDFQELSNGHYVYMKETFPSAIPDTLVAITLIPIKYEYFTPTSSLPDEFIYSRNADEKIDISEEPTNYPVKSISGKTLFYITEKSYSPVITSNKTVSWLRITAIIFLLAFLHSISEIIGKRYGVWEGIALLSAVVIALRVISYYLPFPVNLRQFELFDPTIYGSNPIQKSLGDLLINSILFCWIILLTWSKVEKGEIQLTISRKPPPYWVGLIGTLVLLFSTFITANIIRGLAADSSISFDVMNFFSLNKFSVIGFITLSIIAIGYYYFTRILIRFLKNIFNEKFLWVYVVLAFSGLIYLTFIFINPQTRFFIFVLAWLLMYTFLMQLDRFTMTRLRVNVTNALLWMFIFSVSITTVIIKANREKEWEIRKRLANKVHVEKDPVNERQLSNSFNYIDNDFLSGNFYRFLNENTSKQLKDSILRGSYYLNQYDIRIYLFNKDGRGLFNEVSESFNTLNTIYTVQAKETEKENLKYYETAFDKISFIFKQEVKNDEGVQLGSFFVVINPRAYSSEALSFELFRQPNQSLQEESPIYSYAIYEDKKLISPIKDPFPISLNSQDIPIDEYESRTNGEYDELWYKASQERVVVFAKKRESLIEAITLFSYIFGVFLFLVLLAGGLIFLVKAAYQKIQLKHALQMNIRTQVHSTIIFISLLSFLVIGVATISFFISRYKRTNSEKLGRTMEVMVNEMEKRMEDLGKFDDVVPIYDTVNLPVEKLVKDVAEVHNVDVNVYDTTGRLQVTSQTIVYSQGYLSTQMNPEAYYYLNRLRRGQLLQEENISTFSYLSIYAPVRNEVGDVKAYLNIPYFLSQRELNQEISNFIVTIINLNAFIFLIAGIIALFITNRITRSFSIIGEKMKEINLGKANEEIIWNRDDEIGELVNEYNKMVNKLEESASALARSEREGAWREMARQVAHEIKNPLTPMKLSIQYLQKSIDNNNSNVKELTGQVARTLVEQIDHLSRIAADFSQFANIGNTYPEVFDLNEVLHSIGDLYRSNHEIDMSLRMLPKKILVRTDRTQMNRLFTNLLQNAIEACSGQEKCRILLEETKKDGYVQVSIADNGHGIPAEMQSKIFVPNFTTKSSGTGLGLAMCKGIVEQAGGKIWFETSEDKGSRFFVELPTLN